MFVNQSKKIALCLMAKSWSSNRNNPLIVISKLVGSKQPSMCSSNGSSRAFSSNVIPIVNVPKINSIVDAKSAQQNINENEINFSDVVNSLEEINSFLIKNPKSDFRLRALGGTNAIFDVLNKLRINPNDENKLKSFLEISPKLFPCLTNIISSFKFNECGDLKKDKNYLKGEATYIFHYLFYCFSFIF